MVLITLATSSALAIDPLIWRPLPVGGLSVSLITSGYSFRQPDAGDSGAGPRILPPNTGEKTSFVASVSLGNRSRNSISFTFNDAGPRWTFRIVDSEDQEVWRSDSDIASPQVITEDTLAPGKTWKRSARIPLVIDATPLAIGTYTLQAFLNADKSASATSVFEVVPGSARDNNTGIKGQVERWHYSGNGEVGISYGTPVASALVTVTQFASEGVPLRTPFTWTGYTDSEGRFTVNTPPGNYRVTATDGGRPEDLVVDHVPVETVSANVTVQQGSFSSVYLRMYGVITPEITQGIRGTVIRSYIASLKVPFGVENGESTTSIIWNPGFTVRVEQLDAPEGSEPFKWNGFTNALGAFQVATPPGRFRVTAVDMFNGVITATIPPSVYGPSASTIVDVSPASVTQVKLIIAPDNPVPFVPATPSAE
jgi:hypothetical protein